MKFLVLAFLASTSLFAAEMTVLDYSDSKLGKAKAANASFSIDLKTNKGFVKVEATRREDLRRGGYTPGTSRPTHVTRTVVVFKELVPVVGLDLVGDKVNFEDPNGTIECGTMGETRILRKPTLYLSGNCKLQASLKGDRLVVKLMTK